MLVLGAVAVIAVLVLLVSRATSQARGTSTHPTVVAPASPNEALERWTAAGLLTAEQAAAIAEHERRGAAPAVAGPAPRPQAPAAAHPAGRIPAVAEALGYLGGMLAALGIVLLVARAWPDAPTGWRLALSGAPAALILGAGFALRTPRDPALARLQAFLWLASTACTALFVGVLVVDGLGRDAPETVVLAVGLTVALQSGLLWRVGSHGLQQVAFLVAAVVSAGAVAAELGPDAAIGGAVWAGGALCLGFALTRRITRPALTELVGALAVIVGSIIVASDRQTLGLPFAVLTAGGLLALAAVPGPAPDRTDRIVLTTIGALALMQVGPGAVGYFAEGAGVATGCVVWAAGAGLLVVGGRRMVRAPVVVEALGAAAMVGGAAITGLQSPGVATVFGIATAVGLIALATWPGHVLGAVFGCLGLLVNVPWAIGWYFPGEGRAPLLVFVSGALIVGIAVLFARLGGRFRRELGGPLAH